MNRSAQPPGVASRLARTWRWVGAWPRQCELCRGWSGAALCADCLARFAAPRPRCPRCALPAPEGRVCGQCLRRPPSFDAAAAAVDYAFPWDGLLARFKFHAQPELGIALAQRMIAAIAGLSSPRATLVLPVPLGRDRLRERGYNQAWELARRIGRRLDLPARADLLARGHATTHQVGLSRAEREANLRHSLWVEPAAATAIAHQHVALVDDVMTTGATADAAASALRRAGAAHVQVWVLARTPEPPGREAAPLPRQ